VVRDEAIVRLQKNNERLLKKQLDETRERFRVGELTRTDVAQSESSFSQATAGRIGAEGTLQMSKAVYLQVVGRQPINLSEPENIHMFLPATFPEALAQAENRNYGVLRARKNLESKDYAVKANYGPLLPQINASAEAAKAKTDPRNAAFNDTTVDSVEFGATLSIPLYDAGMNRAVIRQSKYAKWQAHEQVMSAERAAISGVTSYWESMVANDAMIVAMMDSVRANQIALEGVKKEQTLGNRTIFDVLSAYQTLLDSQVNVVLAKREYYLSALQVMQSMGKLTAKDLNLNVELYNAKKHYKETRGRWLSTSVGER